MLFGYLAVGRKLRTYRVNPVQMHLWVIFKRSLALFCNTSVHYLLTIFDATSSKLWTRSYVRQPLHQVVHAKGNEIRAENEPDVLQIVICRLPFSNSSVDQNCVDLEKNPYSHLPKVKQVQQWITTSVVRLVVWWCKNWLSCSSWYVVSTFSFAFVGKVLPFHFLLL